MAEPPSIALIQLGRLWVIDNYPYNSTHLLKSLEWVDRLAPDASEAVRLATLTHDMERAFGGPDAIPIKMSDRAYEEAHSESQRQNRRRVASRKRCARRTSSRMSRS